MASAREPGPEHEPYQVVARRFRPTTWAEMVGQDTVLASLRQALAQKTVPHAFLFAGSRGVGKTTSARILARCLNCERGPTPEPCGTCELCTSIRDGSNPDVIEVDAASNRRIDDMRPIIEHVGFSTLRSRYRVVILDEAHMLTKEASNALLKTLEEPPPRVVFVLATTELHKVLETIRSRCQVLRFRRVDEGDLQQRLRMIADAERVAIPDDVLAEIAASVRGGVRDAETALERVLPLARDLGAKFDLAAYRTLVARVGLDATVEVVERLLAGDAGAGLHFARMLHGQGSDEREALGEIVDVLRWLLLLVVDGPDSTLVPLGGSLRQQLQRLAASTPIARLDGMIAAGVLGRERLRQLEDRTVVLELTLVRMSQAASLPTVADLLAEVRAGGIASAPVPVAAPAVRAAPRASGVPPATAAAAPPPPPATPLAPPAGDLRARTLALLQNRPLLHGTMELCRFDGPNDAGIVTVTLVSDRTMYRDRLAAPQLQAELTQVIQEAAGRPVKVDWKLPSPAPAANAPAAKPVTDPGPRTKGVLGAFGGRVVQVNPQDRQSSPAPSPADDDGAPPDEPPPNLQE